MNRKRNQAELGLGGGSLLQLAHRSPVQMMSYIIDTPEGKVIVYDGGYYCAEDADNLYGELQKRGGHVDLWIITHAHQDHFGALIWMMEKYPVFDIVIEKLCFHFPDREWLARRERFEFVQLFYRQLEQHPVNIVTPQAGEILECGSVSIEIVTQPVEYEEYPSINSTSMVTICHFPKRDVLFLGDFDRYAQAEYVRRYDVSKLRKDIVQMAHHGQDGLNRDFYELISPKICLYPTPKWLWENNLYGCDDPATVGKGPFTTLQTRKWMEELGVERSFTQEAGDWLFV